MTDYIDNLVSRFLTWKLPETVCADPCASMRDYPNRTGTNLLTAVEARQMIEHLLSGEIDYRAWAAVDPDHVPEGTEESLAACATMLETYGPECFPANEQGQVDFARAMMDAVAADIRAFLSPAAPSAPCAQSSPAEPSRDEGAVAGGRGE